MKWQEYGKILTEILALEGSPVAVTYTDQPVVEGVNKKYAVCGAIAAAKRGEVINLSAANCTCPGGSGHIGLAPRSLENFNKLKFSCRRGKIAGNLCCFLAFR